VVTLVVQQRALARSAADPFPTTGTVWPVHCRPHDVAHGLSGRRTEVSPGVDAERRFAIVGRRCDTGGTQSPPPRRIPARWAYR
jgi:hypothetical protein